MLGESVLSLVLVVEDLDGEVRHPVYLYTYILLMLNTFLLHFIHFSVYPDAPEHHVARKNRKNGILYIFMSVYALPASLMLTGVGNKYVLKHVLHQSEEQEKRDHPIPRVTATYCLSLAANCIIISIMG